MSHRFQFEPDRDPWERQSGETDMEWEAFTFYRDGVPGRPGMATISSVAVHMKRDRSGLADSCSENHWVERREAWSREKDKIAREKLIEDLRKMGEEHAKIAGAAFRQIMRPLVALTKPRILADEKGFPLRHRASGHCPACGPYCQMPDRDGEIVVIDRDLELESAPTSALLMLSRSMAVGLEPLARVEKFSRGDPGQPPVEQKVADDPESDDAMKHFADMIVAMQQIDGLDIAGLLGPGSQTADENGEIHVEPL
jgi:hypothetical protein